MYKDKDRQKEANRIASQKRRAKAKGMTEQGMTEQGMTPEDMPSGVIPINLELCRTCQEPLPPLEKPRSYPGMCLGCVTEKYRVVKPGVPVGSTV